MITCVPVSLYTRYNYGGMTARWRRTSDAAAKTHSTLWRILRVSEGEACIETSIDLTLLFESLK